jgi:hypothetical protein
VAIVAVAAVLGDVRSEMNAFCGFVGKGDCRSYLTFQVKLTVCPGLYGPAAGLFTVRVAQGVPHLSAGIE